MRPMADDAVKKKYPENSAPIVKLDLEAEIARAEQAVIARDLRIRRRAGMVVHRVRREAVRHAGGGLLLGAGTIALTWWLNRLSRKNAPPPQAAAAPQQEPPHTFEHLFRDTAIAATSLLPMLWPMLPRQWRRIVSPGTASSVLTFIAPLLGKLLRRKPRQTPAS
jgi:hypothetical protein